MESHMNSTMKSHLDLACKKLEQQEEKLEQQEEKLEEQEEKLEIHSNRMEAAEKNIEMLLNRFSLDKENESFTWEILNIGSRLKNDYNIYSEPFFLRGYRMVLKFLSDGKQTILVGFVIKRGKFDNELEWPFTGKLHIDFAVGHTFRNILCSILLQPNKAIPRPVSPNEEKGGDTKEFAGLGSLFRTHSQLRITAKFVD